MDFQQEMKKFDEIIATCTQELLPYLVEQRGYAYASGFFGAQVGVLIGRVLRAEGVDAADDLISKLRAAVDQTIANTADMNWDHK